MLQISFKIRLHHHRIIKSSISCVIVVVVADVVVVVAASLYFGRNISFLLIAHFSNSFEIRFKPVFNLT